MSDAKRQPVVLTRLYDARAPDRTIDLDGDWPTKLRDDQLLWIDIAHRDLEAVRSVAERLQLRPGTPETLVDPGPDVLVRRHDAYLHVGLRSIEAGENEAIDVVRIDVIAAPNMVLTVHNGPVRAFERFENEISDVSQLGRLDAAAFLSALVDAVLAEYLALVEDLERRIDRLDVVALRSHRSGKVLGELVALRMRAAIMRRSLAPHRPAFVALSRPEFAINERLGQPWPDLLGRLDATLAAIEAARDLLLGTHELVMTRVAQRTNDTVKTLTILSAVLLPASLLSSILGMNFSLPVFSDSRNFWVAVGFMAALMLLTLGVAIARDRGWPRSQES